MKSKVKARPRIFHGAALFVFFIVVASLGFAASPPVLSRLLPSGGQRGQTVTVTASGKFETWPVQVWTDEPGTTWNAQSDNGKFDVVIDPQAMPGARRVRFHTAEGVTSARAFLVGVFAESSELEPNDEFKKPQPIETLPKIVNGVLEKRGDVDVYSVTLAADETLVASIDANRTLKSPVDACLQILSPSGHVRFQSLDARGLDPQLVYRAPRDEQILVRVFGFPETPDQTIGFAGGENFVYRLTLTTGGFLEGTLPLAIGPEELTSLKPVGINLPTAHEPLDIARLRQWQLARVFSSQFANSLELPIRRWPLVIEETLDAAAPPQLVDVPILISGCLEAPGDQDVFRWTANKGRKYRIQMESRALDYPTDGVLVVCDHEGHRLTREDDSEKRWDPTLVWQAPTEGEYQLIVSDLHGRGGYDFLYRVTIAEEQPDFVAQVAQDIFSGKVGESIEVPITIKRTGDLNDSIRFSVVGLPESCHSEAVVSEGSGDTSKRIKLLIKGDKPWVGPIRINSVTDGRADLERFLPVGDTSSIDLWLVFQ